MGVFELPAPLFCAADRLLQVALPLWALPLVWGVCTASAASWIYYKLSPQDRIGRLKREAVQARSEMLAYDGDFNGVLPLAGRTLAISGKRLLLSIGPALAASLPALLVITHLDGAYGQSAGQFLAHGPSWVRGWETPFLSSAALAGVTIKFLFPWQ